MPVFFSHQVSVPVPQTHQVYSSTTFNLCEEYLVTAIPSSFSRQDPSHSACIKCLNSKGIFSERLLGLSFINSYFCPSPGIYFTPFNFMYCRLPSPVLLYVLMIQLGHIQHCIPWSRMKITFGKQFFKLPYVLEFGVLGNLLPEHHFYSWTSLMLQAQGSGN